MLDLLILLNMNSSIDAIHIHFNKESLLLLNICLGYLMFGVALELNKRDFLQLLRHPRKAFAGVLSQYLVFPSITFLLIKILHPHPSVALGMILVSACPSGNISNFITHTAKGNTALSVSLTALSTILSPVFTPLIFSILGNLDKGIGDLMRAIHISFYDILTSLFILLLLPLLLGILINYYFPKFTESSKKFFKISSLLIFFLFILGALIKNRDIFSNYIYLVIGIVFIQDLLGFSSGYLLAKLFRLEERDCRSISIETGIHNSGLGLILAFTFFKGLGGMVLILAWWGIWHLIAGISLAYYWNKKSPQNIMHAPMQY
ncbi:MAG: Bile acid:sodium symporter [Bacteroidota bacterium]|nr:Bile acid:sodium symporter [Bacteroidota bacterium]